jgi:short-subunit dehydrogenase
MQAAPSRVVVITGGSSGIGLCTALLFARRGWRIGLIARSEPGLEAAAAAIRALGAPVATAAADVTDSAALAAAAQRLDAALGPPEIWINNAGVGFFGRFTDTGEDAFHQIVHTTFLGQVYGTRVALAAMTPRARGTIVGIGSELAFRGVPLQSAYSASKFALRGFYEALRAELMHDRIPVHIAMVHPPAVNTPFFSHAGARFDPPDSDSAPRPLPPVYQPELVAEAIWLAVSEQRRDILVGGSSALTVAMNRLMPGVLDRVMGLAGMAVQRTKRRDVAALRAPALSEGTSTGTVHGPFGREARTTSMQMWLQRNRYAIGLAGIGLAIALRSPRKPARPARPRPPARTTGRHH